jgi:hypothetical protein
MNILPKVYISPLLASQKFFIDIHGKPNAYLDTNPSLHIDSSGNTTVLVRRVNYRKFCNKTFSIYEGQSKSDYCIARSHIDIPFNYLEFEPLTYDYNRPTYNTYWLGLEDIRFINSSNILVTVPELNPSGQPCIFQATLEGNKVHSFVVCNPNQIEKNWMPFLENEEPHVIYKVNPLTRKGVVSGDLQEIMDSHPDLIGYHGSTNGIEFQGQQLFLIHTSRDRSYHRWLLVDFAKKSAKWSDEFVFFSGTYIEFPCSLCSYKGRIFVSLGVNDDKALLLELAQQDIDAFL